MEFSLGAHTGGASAALLEEQGLTLDDFQLPPDFQRGVSGSGTLVQHQQQQAGAAELVGSQQQQLHLSQQLMQQQQQLGMMGSMMGSHPLLGSQTSLHGSQGALQALGGGSQPGGGMLRTMGSQQQQLTGEGLFPS